jgi:hypothetical protein
MDLRFEEFAAKGTRELSEFSELKATGTLSLGFEVSNAFVRDELNEFRKHELGNPTLGFPEKDTACPWNSAKGDTEHGEGGGKDPTLGSCARGVEKGFNSEKEDG